MNDAELRAYIEDCQAAITQANIRMEFCIKSRDLASVKACAELIKDNAEMIIDALIAHEVNHE